MAQISSARVKKYLQKGDNAVTKIERGKALENLICYVATCVPGVSVQARNQVNSFDTEEVDVVLWNDKSRNGFHFLPHVIFVECKNWTQPVGSMEVAYFASRLESSGCDHGILVAANGVTGNPHLLTAANFELASALRKGVRIIVITRDEILSLSASTDLVSLTKRKLCQIALLQIGG